MKIAPNTSRKRSAPLPNCRGAGFPQVGGGLSGGHNAAQITQLTLTAIERGCTSLNYYMFYGGSNFGYVPLPRSRRPMTTTAPLRESGAEGDRYFAVKAIGGLLKEHGDQLIHSNPVELTIEGDHTDVSIYLRRSDDGSRFYFFAQCAAKRSTISNCER